MALWGEGEEKVAEITAFRNSGSDFVSSLPIVYMSVITNYAHQDLDAIKQWKSGFITIGAIVVIVSLIGNLFFGGDVVVVVDGAAALIAYEVVSSRFFLFYLIFLSLS